MMWCVVGCVAHVVSSVSADLCGIFNQMNHIKSCNEIKMEDNQTTIIENVESN